MYGSAILYTGDREKRMHFAKQLGRLYFLFNTRFGLAVILR